MQVLLSGFSLAISSRRLDAGARRCASEARSGAQGQALNASTQDRTCVRRLAVHSKDALLDSVELRQMLGKTPKFDCFSCPYLFMVLRRLAIPIRARAMQGPLRHSAQSMPHGAYLFWHFCWAHFFGGKIRHILSKKCACFGEHGYASPGNHPFTVATCDNRFIIASP